MGLSLTPPPPNRDGDGRGEGGRWGGKQKGKASAILKVR